MKSALGKSTNMEPYYQYLVKEGLFDTMKDVMLLAIIIGFKNGSKTPFDKYGGDAIKEHIFKDDMDFLNIIAVLSTKDIKILLNENKEEKYKLLEEYAETGMSKFVSEVFANQYTSAEKILDYVNKFAPGITSEKKDLSGLFGAIIDEMSEQQVHQPHSNNEYLSTYGTVFGAGQMKDIEEQQIDDEELLLN